MSKRMLITAGPTHEPLDRVRYIANRSSGKLGIALAEAARDAGWSVRLLLGPVSVVALPDGIEIERFETCAELDELLSNRFAECDVLVMAAAVADYVPVRSSEEKIPRNGDRIALELKPTPDLVAKCAATKRVGQFIVGFALEEAARVEARGREKLSRKGLDAIVANPLETMGADEIGARVIAADGSVVAPDHGAAITKSAFAAWLIEWIGEASRPAE